MLLHLLHLSLCNWSNSDKLTDIMEEFDLWSTNMSQHRAYIGLFHIMAKSTAYIPIYTPQDGWIFINCPKWTRHITLIHMSRLHCSLRTHGLNGREEFGAANAVRINKGVHVDIKQIFLELDREILVYNQQGKITSLLTNVRMLRWEFDGYW